MKPKLQVLEQTISTDTKNGVEYICITDIARYKNSDRTDDLIRNWLCNRNTIEFLGIWEQLNNPDFKPVEFDGFKKQAGLNSFTLTLKQWIEKTAAIGIISKVGRYGGTYAQKNIAFEFASWILVEFKLCLIKEFQRLKEQKYQQLGWDIKRNLAKVNCFIHANVHQLVCLANMESLNAHFIDMGQPQSERLVKLNEMTIRQMSILVKSHASTHLEINE